MRRSPSIVPETDDRDIYLVLVDFGGHLGRAWPETDEERTDRETVIRDLFEGQYSDPVRVVAFNTAEGWSRDVSEEIADELAQRLASEWMMSRRRWMVSLTDMAGVGLCSCRCLCVARPDRLIPDVPQTYRIAASGRSRLHSGHARFLRGEGRHKAR